MTLRAEAGKRSWVLVVDLTHWARWLLGTPKIAKDEGCTAWTNRGGQCAWYRVWRVKFNSVGRAGSGDLQGPWATRTRCDGS